MTEHNRVCEMIQRVVVFVVLVGVGVGSAWAQGSVGAIKLGGAVSSLSGASNSEFEPRTGLAAGVAYGYDFGNGLAVYGRHGQGCRVCGAGIRSAAMGGQARPTWWCPRCQPAVPADATR